VVCELQSPISSRFTHSVRLFSSLEVGALGWLRQLLVGGRGHVSSDLDKYGLHSEVAFPVRYAGEFGEVDLWKHVISTIGFGSVVCRVSALVHTQS